jgi:hypothetical protein
MNERNIMNPTVGASIFPATAAQDVISSVTTVVTDNIAPVLVLLGFYIGLRLAVRLFSGAAKSGKLKV